MLHARLRLRGEPGWDDAQLVAPTHILRQHFDRNDAIRLENTLKAMREGTGGIDKAIN